MMKTTIRSQLIMMWVYKGSMLLVTALFFSCSKTKVDAIRSYPYDEQITSSTARVVFAAGMKIKVNGTELSSFYTGPVSAGGPDNPPVPTPYFPTTGRPGNTYFIPQEFIKADGKAVVELGPPDTKFEVEDNYSEPLDYYCNQQGNPAELVITEVPRPVVKPSRPENMLIRLVNLSSDAVVNSGSNETLSLAYANGSSVGETTSHIAKGKWSGYTEIPYGTYEFRVMIDGTVNQYPALPPYQMSIEGGDDFTLMGAHRYFTQKQVFQPGGVYTIAVTFNNGNYEDSRDYTKAKLNAFKVITDLTPAANLSYARIQAANAITESSLRIRLDNNDLTPVAYGEAGNYAIVTKGTHTIQLTDPAGSFTLEEKLTVKGGDNFTLWVHPGQDKKGKLTVVQNNMSGVINLSENADGSDGSTAISDPLTLGGSGVQTRFLNLYPGLPYATFTARNGATLLTGIGYPVAAANIPYGSIPDPLAAPYPYINLSNPWIEAYQSQPGSVPGNRLFEVPSLTAGDFINMPPSFYPNGLPQGEPGVYTVALIGPGNALQKPRLVVIKHNK